MKRLLLTVGAAALMSVASTALARQQDTLMGDARRQQGLDSEMARLRGLEPDGSARNGLCPLVRGATPEVNAYVTARLRQVAQEAGARYAQKACEPNMVVLFSAEPDRLVSEASRQGRINYHGVTGPDLQRFKASTQPVRWVHGAPSEAYRTARPFNSLVVVDANQAANVKVSALADYVSLVALADVRPGDAPSSSILNLFDGAETDRLTEADRAYLRRVYGARRAP